MTSTRLLSNPHETHYLLFFFFFAIYQNHFINHKSPWTVYETPWTEYETVAIAIYQLFAFHINVGFIVDSVFN